MKDLSKELKGQRQVLNLTQQDAAMLLNVSRITYVKWEADPGTMPLGKYQLLTSEFERLAQLKEHMEG